MTWRPGDSASRPVEVGAKLSDAPEMIAAGQFAAAAPGGVPEFPEGASIKQAIAVGAKGRKTILWEGIHLLNDVVDSLQLDCISFEFPKCKSKCLLKPLMS